MGRTEPTFRLLLERIEAEWRDYRRGLDAREQSAFDALFQKARAHASASSNVCRVDPLESVLLSMLLEHELELRALRARLDDIWASPSRGGSKGDTSPLVGAVGDRVAERTCPQTRPKPEGSATK
jgi:hypothetical protein